MDKRLWLGVVFVGGACAKVVAASDAGAGGPAAVSLQDAGTGAGGTQDAGGGTPVGGAGGMGAACGGAPCGPSEWCANPGVGGFCANSNDANCMLGCTDPVAYPVGCVPRPEKCAVDVPVCGCDGNVYPSACEAAVHGVGADYAARCSAPEGKFACGPLFCSKASQYCLNERVGAVADLSCVPVPPCDAGDPCACVQAELGRCGWGAYCEVHDGAVSAWCDST